MIEPAIFLARGNHPNTYDWGIFDGTDYSRRDGCELQDPVPFKFRTEFWPVFTRGSSTLLTGASTKEAADYLAYIKATEKGMDCAKARGLPFYDCVNNPPQESRDENRVGAGGGMS
jgi:hypothetical protein